MDNQKTQATFGTRHRMKTKLNIITTQKANNMINTDPIKIPEVNPGAL